VTETEHEQHTTLPEHQVEKAETIGRSVRDLPRQARATPTEVAQTGRTPEQVKAGYVQRGDARTIRVNKDEIGKQRGDAHTIRVNEDEIGDAKAEYRVKRPRRIDGLTAGKAKGPLMPSKNGAQAAYTASDLTNDIRTGLVAIIPPEDWEEEHEERPAPKREVASVSREYKVMARAAKPDMANTSTVSREQHAEAAEQAEAPRVAAANASCGPTWQAGGSTPTEPPEGAPLHKWWLGSK
jgi:hypothetical protein